MPNWYRKVQVQQQTVLSAIQNRPDIGMGRSTPIQQNISFPVAQLNPRLAENKPTTDGVLQLVNHHLSQLGRQPLQDLSELPTIRDIGQQIVNLMDPVHISILPEKEGFWIDDGAHRVQLAKMLGVPQVKAMVYQN